MKRLILMTLVAALVVLSSPGATYACNNISGSLSNALDTGPYYPDCASAIAIHDNFPGVPVQVGTCSTDYTYSIPTAHQGGLGNWTVIITWNPGPNGTPTNQPEQVVIADAGNVACVNVNAVAQSGPLAVIIDGFSASSTGERTGLALMGLALLGLVGLTTVSRRKNHKDMLGV
jgi:MYXO-CTERM domain-containing protein